MRNNILRGVINLIFALHLNGDGVSVDGDAGETALKVLFCLCIANVVCSVICVFTHWNDRDRNYIRM